MLYDPTFTYLLRPCLSGITPSLLRCCLSQVLYTSSTHLNASWASLLGVGVGRGKGRRSGTQLSVQETQEKGASVNVSFKKIIFLNLKKKTSWTYRNVNTVQEDFILGNSLSISCFVTSSLWKFQCMYPIIKGILPHHPSTNKIRRLTLIHCH